MTGPATPPPAPLPTPPVGDPASPSTPVPSTEGGDTPPAATDPTGTEAAPPVVDEWANFDAERAKQTIIDQRKAEAKLKAQLAAAKAKVEAHEREKLTEAERMKADLDAANARLAEVEREASDIAARNAFDSAATAAGILPNALAAARAIAADVAASDESGTMIVDDTLFASLKADHGYLFTSPQQARPPQVTFGAASSQGQGGKPTTLTPAQVAMAQRAGIKPEDFANAAARITR